MSYHRQEDKRKFSFLAWRRMRGIIGGERLYHGGRHRRRSTNRRANAPWP